MGRKRTVPKAATYGNAIRWLADNGQYEITEDGNTGQTDGLVTTLLVADLFGADPRSVAIDVVRTSRGAGPFA